MFSSEMILYGPQLDLRAIPYINATSDLELCDVWYLNYHIEEWKKEWDNITK